MTLVVFLILSRKLLIDTEMAGKNTVSYKVG